MMGIKTNTRDIANLSENIKNIFGIASIIPDTLLGLAETLENRIVLDATTAQFFENIEKGLDIDQQITDLRNKITDDTKKIKRPSTLPTPNNVVGPRSFNITATDVNSLVNTTTSLETAEQDIIALTADIATQTSHFNANKGNKPENIEAREKATNTNHILNLDLRESNRIVPLLKELKELQTFKKNYGAILTNRKAEFADMKSLSANFDLSGNFQTENTIQNPTKNLTNFEYKDTLLNNLPLKEIFFGNNTPEDPEYAICDASTGKILEYAGGYKLNINGKDVKVKGLTIHNGNELKIKELEIDPIQDINFPVTIKFGIRGSQQISGVYLDMFKNVTINLQSPKMPQSDRETEFDNYNGSGNRITNHLTTKRDSYLHKLEREAIERAIKDGDGPKYEQLTAEQKEQFYQHIRGLKYPGTGSSFFNHLNPLLNIDYANFKSWFVSNDRDWNKDLKNISSRRKYNDFIHNNLETKSTEYINSRLDNFLISGPSNVNNFLKGELTTFLNEIEKQKLDNNMHDDVTSDISDGKGGRHRLNRKRRSILGLFRLGRQDETPMRFFNGSKTSVKNQKVNITTNNGPEDLNNKEPVEYGLDLEVSGKNKIEATITLEGEPPFTLKSGDPAALIRNVLRHQPIKYGKVRAHIAYNIIKGIIKMSNDIDMPLVYQYDTNKNREIKMDGDSIILEEQDDTSSKRTTSKLFDYKLFEATNTFESTITGDNRSLRNGIDKLMGHMTCALNKRHNQFCKATEFRRNSTTNFPTSYRTSPLKKLLNVRTNTNFDFETTVQGKNGKNIQVKFSKNKFTLNYEGLKKPISSKSIGVLLDHVQGGSRVFDGVERELCAGIYGEMIKKLRTNSKIAKTNFAVKDDVTGRTYVLDDDGKFGYISNKESARDGAKIKKKNWMNYATKGVTTGGLIAGGFLTGGIGAVLNPFSWKGLATIPLFAGGALSAANLGFYGKKNFPAKDGGFDYGVIDQNPPGLVMCTESQTKEILKNPLLMGRMIKAMNDRLGSIHFK